MDGLVVDKVSMIYGGNGGWEIKALENVEFQVSQGDFLAVVGASGCGKTTLLRIIGGLVEQTEGEIVFKKGTIEDLHRNCGFVFQDPTLLPWRDVLGNILLPLEVARGGKRDKREGNSERDEEKKKVKELLAMVELEGFEHFYPRELSGGMKQRVAIARALAVNPDVIVADEPTGNLDSASGEQILDIIGELHEKKGKTVIMVTHERYVAERAQQILHLKDGKIVQKVKRRISSGSNIYSSFFCISVLHIYDMSLYRHIL